MGSHVPELRWMNADTGYLILDGTTVRPKAVRIYGDPYGESEPERFDIWKVPTRLVRAWRGWRGKVELTRWESFQALNDPAAPSRRVSPAFVLPSPSGRLGRTYVFSDGLGNRSGRIKVTSLGDVKVKNPAVTVGGASFGAGVIEVSVMTAVDPMVGVGLLTPWDREANLQEYLMESLTDEGEDDSVNDLLGVLQRYLPERRPEGWEFEVTGQSVLMEAGRRYDFGIGFEAGSPATVALAVQATDIEDRDVASASDVFFLRVDAQGAVRILTGAQEILALMQSTD